MKRESKAKINQKPKPVWMPVFIIIFIISIGAVFGSMRYVVKVNNTTNEPNLNLEQEIEKLAEFSNDVEKKNLKILENPPEEVKALYLTSFSAGSEKKMNEVIDLIEREGLNAVVIDIKDSSGYVAYDTEVEEVIQNNAVQIKIPEIDSLLEKLHKKNIYVIARVVVFQDPLFSSARPDLAIKNNITGGVWRNYKGLSWIDPSASEYWDYIVKISKDASARGFDEINYDYIRFPSDGNLRTMSFSFFDEEKTPKHEVMKEFFAYLNSNLPDIKISVDLFGLATVNDGDLGIGQVIEDAYESFDYICPMVYPSHYANGFIGFQNPAQYPYEVVKYSIEKASERLDEFNKKRELEENSENKKIRNAKIRPWLQAFDMGAVYGVEKVNLQIQASYESGGVGWILWNASNSYSSRVVGINN
ncbi:MAG: putative glycoside hydrolase [Patescibacteria group bacterium]|nr:putative glycoside hydrolase [Patescibacteria group bacterium]